jgi:hypothetical protein
MVGEEDRMLRHGLQQREWTVRLRVVAASSLHYFVQQFSRIL